MFFHVILTTECNLQCLYCFGEALGDVDADFPDAKTKTGGRHVRDLLKAKTKAIESVHYS